MSTPQIQRHGNSIVFTWPPDPRKVVLSRFHESSRSIDAEFTLTTVLDNITHLITSAKINLQSLPTRKKLALDLQERLPDPSWRTKVEQICVLGLRHYREGEPIAPLESSDQDHVPFLVNPIIYEGHQTLIYSPGGSCKSYLALYVALHTSHGLTQNGLSSLACPVLYLDWELDRTTTGIRQRNLQQGHPELSKYVPYYRRCTLPLHDELDVIAEHVAEHGVRLVIVDSAIMACGDDLSSTQAPVKLQRALRALGCSALVLTHSPKNGEEKTAFGSVFFKNLARNEYQLELKEETKTSALVTMVHTKKNFGPRQETVGFQFDFTKGCRVSTFDPATHAAAQASLPLPNRIRNLLDSDGVPRSAKEVADQLGVKLKVAQSTLSRFKGFKWSMIGENREALWTTLKH